MLDGNLSAIRTACETAIKASSSEKTNSNSTSTPKKVQENASEKKKSPELQKVFKKMQEPGPRIKFPTSESLTDDRGIYDGRREDSEEDK